MPKRSFRLFTSVCWLLFLTIAATCHAQSPATTTISVDCPAFVFSPGNWVGDDGRAGKIYRQSWNPGAYFRVTWESDSSSTPTLLLDTSTHGEPFGAPKLAYCLDGIWQGDVACAAEIPLEGARASGKHVLSVFLKSSVQKERWGSPGTSGRNVLRVNGLRIEASAKPLPCPRGDRWALIVGDSITEGSGVDGLECYSHLVGEALQSQGYEYGVSACGWSGWLNRGDNPPGDVPGYYIVTDSVDGTAGQYHEPQSRWNKIDANHSLLDTNKHISGQGSVHQEPALILINYGTNDSLWKQNDSDVQASIRQGLNALRTAAPDAHLFVLIPFGQYKAKELHRAASDFQAAHPQDQRFTVIDLGTDVARALTAQSGHWGGLHPNAVAHATLAGKIVAHIMAAMHPTGSMGARPVTD